MREAREKLNRARIMLQATLADREVLPAIEAMNILAEKETEVRHQEVIKFHAQIKKNYKKVA